MKHRFGIFPPEFTRNPVFVQAFALACVYVFLAMTQLFSFEKFATVTSGFGLPGDMRTAAVVAGLLPLLEVASVPYLLSMRVPGKLWRTSRVCALMTALLWFVLSVWVNFRGAADAEAGLFGATLPLPAGLWMIGFSALLLYGVVLVMRVLPERK